MSIDRSDAFVFFGATGDLAFKKTFRPAMATFGTTTSTCRSVGRAVPSPPHQTHGFMIFATVV